MARTIKLTLLRHNGGNIQLKASQGDPCSQKLTLHNLKSCQNSHKSPQIAKAHISTNIIPPAMEVSSPAKENKCSITKKEINGIPRTKEEKVIHFLGPGPKVNKLGKVPKLS